MYENSQSPDAAALINLSMDKISLGARDMPVSQSAIPQKLEMEQL